MALLALQVMAEVHFSLQGANKVSCMILSKCVYCAGPFVGQHFAWFDARLCRRIVGVPLNDGCVPLVAGLFLFCGVSF